MRDQLVGSKGRAVELLDLRDRLDRLDQELRIRRVTLVATPLVSTVLAAPLLAVLFVNEAPFFAAYPFIFVVLLGAILYAITVERRRLEGEREEVRERIRQIEDPPFGS